MKIIKLHGEKHKYVAIFDDNRKTKFGFSGMSDYVHHHDEARKKRYQDRHRKDLDTNDYHRAGYLSFYILWNKPTIEESLRDYKKRFRLN